MIYWSVGNVILDRKTLFFPMYFEDAKFPGEKRAK